MADTLLLIDKYSNIDELIKKSKSEDSKIICFEVQDHLFLSKSNIDHKIVETYINDSDKRLIEKSALEKTLGWHKQKGILEFLDIDNINLGWLIEQEFYQYLFQIIRYFIGVMRILEKEKPSKIYTSENLSLMIKSICSSESIDIFSYPNKEESNFYSDRVEIPISVGNKHLTLHTSRDSALKIKRIAESFTNFIFDLKYNDQSDDKSNSILLMEFNNIFYESFLQELSSLGINIILLNERKPAVWNFQSLKIVKKFNCKILHLDNIPSNIHQKILEKHKELINQLKIMFSNDKLLETIFSLNGKTFWPSMKSHFISNCTKRFQEALKRIELSKEFFKTKKIKLLVTMYDMGFEERAILAVAHNLKIPGILLQHGIYPQNEYIKQFIPIAGIIPHLNLKESVWGEKIKNYLLEMNVPENHLILSGSLRHDGYFQFFQKKPSNKILLATNVIVGWDYNGFDILVHTNYQNNIKEICKIVNNIPEKKLIIKLHPAKSPIDNIEEIISNVNSSIPIHKTGDIFDYILDSEVLISTDWSTVLLEAMILGIPTITFPSDPKGFEEEDIIQSGATVLVKNLDEFKKALDDILHNKEYCEEIISKGKKFVEQYLVNKGTASKFLANTINQNYFD
ncbi:hypothetical protein C6990_06295 [Nitrosopumilus sp. b3]|uniref:hypothetical protein n=1 Tax=Nitrosopumilus sp. b3 TaxID=2109909 RepID=UPI0015F67924|nr:hypothetical protein [Nitrosopumilus sp. b3]KAF6246726.1 hypothetical protein C6990_06295 [Nitrosopumilus sp. b3]